MPFTVHSVCVTRVSQVLILSKTFINKTFIYKSVAEIPSGVTESRALLSCDTGDHIWTHILAAVPRNNLLVEKDDSLFTQSKENHPALIITR